MALYYDPYRSRFQLWIRRSKRFLGFCSGHFLTALSLPPPLPPKSAVPTFCGLWNLYQEAEIGWTRELESHCSHFCHFWKGKTLLASCGCSQLISGCANLEPACLLLQEGRPSPACCAALPALSYLPVQWLRPAPRRVLNCCKIFGKHGNSGEPCWEDILSRPV